MSDVTLITASHYHARMRVRRGAWTAPVGSYLLTLAFVAIATAGLIFLQYELPFWFNLPIVVIAYLLVINVATQMAGFAAGVVAAVASFLCFNFFFIDPRGTLLESHDQTSSVRQRS